MPFHYAGFNTGSLFTTNGKIVYAIDSFAKVPFEGITDFQIGWGYFLLWRGKELHICKESEADGNDAGSGTQVIQIPEKTLDSSMQAAIGRDNIVILSRGNEIWRYKIYENSWKKVINFITSSQDSEDEYCVKIAQGGCTVALTNLGRVYNVPTLVDAPKRVRFIDIACGFDHTLLLEENGDIYTMGMGTRGQLGHNDLEDCDNPRLVEALAGIKVVQISAAGWHSAVVTDQGDLYTWGWNTNGELGLPSQDCKVLAVPTLVDFTDDRGEDLEVHVRKAGCGTTFTVCVANDGTLWGSGCNKYGQLGQSREAITGSTKFIQLNVPLNRADIRDIKCNEWGTALLTD